jgi:aminoglycoside phosphotransferase (APT) family kinase protein
MPIQGGQCKIYRVVFSDDITWAVRLPTRLSSEAASQVLREENQILRRLQASGFGWSPKLVGEELDHNNPVGFPFSVYEWMPGDPLRWTADTPANRGTRQHLLNQLAEFQLALISCTREDGMQIVSEDGS